MLFRRKARLFHSDAPPELVCPHALKVSNNLVFEPARTLDSIIWHLMVCLVTLMAAYLAERADGSYTGDGLYRFGVSGPVIEQLAVITQELPR